MDERESQQPAEALENNNDNQPDYRPDSQVEASFAAGNLEGSDNYLQINNPGNAQVNINNPVMPANDMVKLEAVHPGAIDRILSMGEKEQAFAHKIIESQHKEELEVSQRNRGISKEQSLFNFAKLFIVSLFILLLIGCAVYLFIQDKTWGGLSMSLVILILASIFVLGHFPTKIFEALFGRFYDDKPPDNNGPEP